MLTGKKLALKKRFLLELKNIEYHPLNASRSVDKLSLLLPLPNMGYFC